MIGLRMEDSSFYQDIVVRGRAEGRLLEARKFLLMLGRVRFGAPQPQTKGAIAAITDLDRLEHLSLRLLDVSSWDELLASP